MPEQQQESSQHAAQNHSRKAVHYFRTAVAGILLTGVSGAYVSDIVIRADVPNNPVPFDGNRAASTAVPGLLGAAFAFRAFRNGRREMEAAIDAASKGPVTNSKRRTVPCPDS